jgi:O-antigen/teichoic acid export membrane protein
VGPESSNENHCSGDSERFLRVDHLAGDLRGRSLRGGAVTLFSQAAKFIFTLVSMAILARMLTPEDFGLIAIGTIVIGFTSVFKDMGLSMATVQRSDVRHAQISTLFWLNLAVSAAIAVLTVAAAPALAWFYKDPRVTAVTVALASTIVIGGLTIQHQALLRRQMRFSALAFVEITSLVFGTAAAIVSAFAGFGYWSLVVLNVAREIAGVFAVWIACPWRPGRPARSDGARSLVSFGAHLSAFNIITYASRNIEKMLIGWYWGAGPLGLYNNAYRILLLPIQQINTPLTNVAVPALSRIQTQPSRYRAYYRRGLLFTVTAGMPVVAFLFVTADKAVLAFLGPQWLDAVAIFRALGPAAFLGTFNVGTGWVYLSLGSTRRLFEWGLISSAVTVLAYFIALPWGTIGVALSLSASLLALRIPGTLYCIRGTCLRFEDAWVPLWRPTVSSTAAGALLFGVGTIFKPGVPVGLSLVFDFVIYLALYALVWTGLPGGRKSVHEIAGILRELRLSRPSQEEATIGDTDVT